MAKKFNKELFEALEIFLIETLGNVPNKNEIAETMIDNLVKHFGGQMIYVPKSLNIFIRNKHIKQEFNGKNHAELAKKIQSFYSIYL